MRLIASLALVIYATGVYASVMDNHLATRDPKKKKHHEENDDGGNGGNGGNSNTPPQCTCDTEDCVLSTLNLGGYEIVNYDCKNDFGVTGCVETNVCDCCQWDKFEDPTCKTLYGSSGKALCTYQG